MTSNGEKTDLRGTILITGGGTAGHTNPGIAVGQALVSLGLRPNQVHYVGGVRGSEGTLVADAGFSIDLLPGRGIQRKLTFENVGSVLGLTAGLVKGLAIVAKRRPKAVLCLGGYAAFAASAAAVILRIPLVVSEQNARASAVNRLFGRFAKVCAVPFPETDLPKGELTGNPIRPSIVEAVAGADRVEARTGLIERAVAADGGPPISDVTERSLVAVWAGSLGARRINTAVNELAELWADRSDVLLYHIVGSRDWETHGGPRSPSSQLAYVRVEYEAHMPELLVGADIALCRAGASTVTELAVAGLPSILVPLPHAPRDHQRANTGELASVGAAIVVDDADVTAEHLAELLDPLLADPVRRAEMGEAARSVGRPDAAYDVARLLLKVGGLGPSQPKGEADA